jgi:hypothetical protein
MLEERVENRAVLQRANDGPVLGRDIIDMRCSGIAARPWHVGHRHYGMAGDVLGHVPREEPRIDVVAAAGRGSDDHRDLPAPIELRDRILGQSRAGRNSRKNEGCSAEQATPHPFARPYRRKRRHNAHAAVEGTRAHLHRPALRI